MSNVVRLNLADDEMVDIDINGINIQIERTIDTVLLIIFFIIIIPSSEYSCALLRNITNLILSNYNVKVKYL